MTHQPLSVDETVAEPAECRIPFDRFEMAQSLVGDFLQESLVLGLLFGVRLLDIPLHRAGYRSLIDRSMKVRSVLPCRD